MAYKALVVSVNFRKGYPIIKSLSKADYTVITAQYSWRGPVFSRYANFRFRIANPYENEMKYISGIVSIARTHKPDIIVPVGFIDNLLLARYRSLIPPHVVIPIPPYEKILEVSNKANLLQIAKTAGLEYPKTSLIDEFDSENFSLPVVVKGVSDQSVPSYAFNKYDLMRLLKKKKNAVVQEFVPGYGCGYFALAKDGNISAEFSHRRVIEKKPSGGPSIVACSYDDPLLFGFGRRIVKHLKWSGILMIEFRRDEETGDYYLIEINPKFWGSLELSVSCGVDFPRYLADLYLLDKYPNFKGYIRGKCFSWILEGMHYLRYNYRVWLRTLVYGIINGSRSVDLHFDDPPDALFSFAQGLGSVFIGKHHFDNALKIPAKSRLEDELKTNGLSHVIFDLDGTLTHLDIHWDKIRKNLIDVGLIRKWDSINMSFHKLEHSSPETFIELNRIVEQYELQGTEKLQPDQKLRRQLLVVKCQNITLAVISKQSREIIRTALTKLDLIDLFDILIGRDDHPCRLEQIRMGINCLGAELDKSLLVGDTLVDITAAAKAGVMSVGISTNPYHIQRLFELNVPCFKSVKELVSFLIATLHFD